jgi:hypothetical protein
MKFPVIELVDRYTIAVVKHQKTQGANQAELDFYTAQMRELDIGLIQYEVARLIQLHADIWAMEDDFKKCRLDGVDLAEIGRRALDIRDLNNSRVTIKNRIAQLLDDPIREIKQDHVSELKNV